MLTKDAPTTPVAVDDAAPRFDLMPTMTPLMASILFHGIDGAPAPPVERARWEKELKLILAHRISGLALAAARDAGFDDDDPLLVPLRNANRAATLRSAMVEGLAVPALAALERMGIPHVVTKGPGIARLYPARGLRPYRDLDVVVAPGDFHTAMDVLLTLGYAEPPTFRQPRAYFDRFCREAVNLVREDGGAIDLHHHVPPWVWGARIGFDRMVELATPVQTAGGTIPLAHPLHNLLVASLHVLSDRGGHEFMMWRDLVTVANACDPHEAAVEAKRAGLDWILSIALESLPASVRPAPLMAALGTPKEPRVGMARLHRLVGVKLSRHQIARAFRYPAPNALAFLIGFGIPSGDFLRSRYGRRLAYPTWWRDAFDGLWSAAEGKRGRRRVDPRDALTHAPR